MFLIIKHPVCQFEKANVTPLDALFLMYIFCSNFLPFNCYGVVNLAKHHKLHLKEHFTNFYCI